MQISLILTAAGNSTRMGNSLKKEYIALSHNKTILSETALAFLQYFQKYKAKTLIHCIITLPQNQIYQGIDAFFNSEVVNFCIKLKLSPEFIEGGNTRQESIYKALLQLEKKQEKTDIVLIHDAARPFVSEEIIENILESTKTHRASVPVIQSIDTQKKLSENGLFIESHLKRDSIVSVQTPQGFLFSEILEAHKKASQNHKTYTDDSEIYSDFFQNPVFIVAGDINNKKITHKNDLPQNIDLENKEFSL